MFALQWPYKIIVASYFDTYFTVWSLKNLFVEKLEIGLVLADVKAGQISDI